MLTGGVAALILFPPRRHRPHETDEEDESARRERLATERDTAASVAFQTALDACRGLPTRLTRIAEAAEAKAAALRDAQDAGLIARATPRERRLAAALGAAARQPTTPRHRLAAPGPSLRPTHRHTRRSEHRSSHAERPHIEQLAKAAREVAKQLDNDDGQRELSSELARCAFCGKPARDVHKIITGPTSAICDECVDLCVEVLGDDWRAPPSE